MSKIQNHNDHVIGLLYDYDNTDTVTASGLRRWLSDKAEIYQNALNDKVWSKYAERFKVPYSLKDYADRRVSTNLVRFVYCPVCGKRLKWNTMFADSDEDT